MRLVEIVPSSNNKQQLNEVAVIAIVPILLGMAAAGLTIADVWNYKKRYDKAEKALPGSGWDEIKGDVYQDAAFIAAGGVVGKLVHKGWKTYKLIKDAKKVVGDIVPLTSKELKELKKLDRTEFQNKWLKLKDAKKRKPKVKKVKVRGKWTSRLRSFFGPFGSKAANDFRKLSKEAQQQELHRLEVAKQLKKKKEIEAGRKRLSGGDKPADTAEVIPKKTKAQKDAEINDRIKKRQEYENSPEGKKAKAEHDAQIDQNSKDLSDKAASRLSGRTDKIDQERLGRAMEIDYLTGQGNRISRIEDKVVKLSKDLTTVPSSAIASISKGKVTGLDAVNKIVNKTASKKIKGTAHAIDAGKDISRGTVVKKGAEAGADALARSVADWLD